MSWRTPYRSGLRDLAESLLQQAETKRRGDELQLQFELQQQQQNTQMWMDTINTVSQAATGYFQQQESIKNAEGQRALGLAESDLNTARSSLAAMEAYNAPASQIENQRKLVQGLTEIVAAPVGEAAGMYDSLMNSTLVPATTTPASVAPAAPGSMGVGMQGGMDAPVDLTPAMTTPARTGADVLTSGMGAVASLQRGANVEDMVTQSVINSLNNFSPNDPASVFNARRSIDMLDSLPPEVRAELQPAIEGAMNAFDNSPEAQEMYDRANRRDVSATEEAETAAASAAAQLDWFNETRPYDRALLEFQVGAAEADAVINAYNTGVTAGLTDAGKTALADFVGVGVDELPEWSRGRAEDMETLRDLELRAERANTEIAERNVTIADQNIALADLRLPHTAWQMGREKYLAGVQDELTVAEGIASAIANNDPSLLSFYMLAYDNPDSPIGQQLRATYGDNYGEVLATEFAGAVERQALERSILQYDERSRAIAVETAEINLRQARILSPMETEALRWKYVYDKNAAIQDVRNLPLATLGNATASLYEMAKAVEPEFWDNLPEDVQGRLNQLGLDPASFAGVSRAAAWTREAPQREQAWMVIDTMLESIPPETNQAEVIEQFGAAVDLLGIEDPTLRQALTSSLEGAWRMNSAQHAKTIASLALDSATVTDGPDAKRAIDAWSSIENSLNEEYRVTKPQAIQDSGCAIALNISTIEGTFGLSINSGSWKTSAADWISVPLPDGSTRSQQQAESQAQVCRNHQLEYMQLAEDISNANRQQQFWAQEFFDSGLLTQEEMPESVNPAATPAAEPEPEPTVSPSETPAPLSPENRETVSATDGEVTPGSSTDVSVPPVPPPEAEAAPAVAPPVEPATSDLPYREVSGGVAIGGHTLTPRQAARFNEIIRMVYYNNYRADDPEFERDVAYNTLRSELIDELGVGAYDAVIDYMVGHTAAQ